MSEAVVLLNTEIARREAELTVLREALNVLAGGGTAAPKLALKALPAPALPRHGHKAKTRGRKAATAKAETDQFGAEVNGLFVVMSETQAAVFDAINACAEGEFIQRAALLDLVDGHAQKLSNTLFELKRRLAPAKATIGYYRGFGYRLEPRDE